MSTAVIVNAKRIPIGKKHGMFKLYSPHELMAPLLKHLARDIENEIDDVIVGNVVGPGGNLARLSALEAELPLSLPGMTIDRQCSAGIEAVRTACYMIQGRAGKCYLAGGIESTSTSPYEKRAQFSPNQIGDPNMGVAAEYVAKRFNITRAMQDHYALLSYERSWNAYLQGIYKQEIIGMDGHSIDEEFLRKRDMTKLLHRARPLFAEDKGTVTAANSCGIHDGASALLIMEETYAQNRGFLPVLRFIDSQVSGVHPNYPGYAPVPAIKELLKRNQLTIGDIDLFEINEAFSSKIIACAQQLSIPYEKLNIHGGALTLGHPYGASGAILITRLFYEVQRRTDLSYVVAAIGSGGGIGSAILFEVVK